jgi:hypothetical protein
MPAMASLLSTITPALTTIMNWTKENPKMTQTIIIGTAAIAALTAAIGLLGLAIPAIITGFGAITAAAKVLGTALLFLTTNPIGLLLTALAALAVAALYIYNNWEAIRPKLQEVWITIGGTIAYAVNTAKNALGEAFDWMKTKAEQVTNWLGDKVQTVMNYATKIKNALENAGASFYDAINDNKSISGAKAFGGPVQAGNSYIVGERGPEVFIPSTNGSIVPNATTTPGSTTVNINLGGVTVRNDQDIKALTSQIEQALARKMQLYKQGIA